MRSWSSQKTRKWYSESSILFIWFIISVNIHATSPMLLPLCHIHHRSTVLLEKNYSNDITWYIILHYFSLLSFSVQVHNLITFHVSFCHFSSCHCFSFSCHYEPKTLLLTCKTFAVSECLDVSLQDQCFPELFHLIFTSFLPSRQTEKRRSRSCRSGHVQEECEAGQGCTSAQSGAPAEQHAQQCLVSPVGAQSKTPGSPWDCWSK